MILRLHRCTTSNRVVYVACVLKDSLYATPCRAEELSFDMAWPQPLLKIVWYPANLHDTMEREGHLDVRIHKSLLLACLEDATQHMNFDHFSGVGIPEPVMPAMLERPKPQIFSYSWPGMLQLPLLRRCGFEMRQPRRTCATNISMDYCVLVHRRLAYQATSSQDLLPDTGNCSCMNAAIEAGSGNDASWNWQQLSNVGFLKLQISRHVLMFWSGNLLTGVTDIFFSMPHKVMGFFGHPSLLELLRRRAFYEDTEAVVCSSQEDCRAKRVLTLVEWLLVARNSLLQHGILSTWELASDEQSIVVNDFRRHTLVVESIFADLTRDSEDATWQIVVGRKVVTVVVFIAIATYSNLISDFQDATWGPSVKLLLQLIKEELSVDFGQTFRVTSPWCNSSIRSIRGTDNGERARLFVDLEVSWFSKLCHLSLESPDQTFEASEGPDEAAEPGEEHSCGIDISPKPLQSGDLLLHVLGHAVVSPMHGVTSTKSAKEVEVLLFAHSLDSCIPVVTESRARHVLSQPHVALFPWRCSFDGLAGQPAEAVPRLCSGTHFVVVLW